MGAVYTAKTPKNLQYEHFLFPQCSLYISRVIMCISITNHKPVTQRGTISGFGIIKHTMKTTQFTCTCSSSLECYVFCNKKQNRMCLCRGNAHTLNLGNACHESWPGLTIQHSAVRVAENATQRTYIRLVTRKTHHFTKTYSTQILVCHHHHQYYLDS